MALDPNELAAFADGELPEARAAEVAMLVEADPELARQVAAHERVKAMLATHYAPILDQPLPEHLTAMLTREDKIVDLTAAREQREAKRGLPRWSWLAAPALAASLALSLMLPRSEEAAPGYAEPQLASLLDNRLVAEQSPGAETRVLLSFQDDAGRYCRAFSSGEASGIVCRDTTGWKFEAHGVGGGGDTSDYRMAGATEAGLMARAQEMAQGGALDAEQEEAARARGWDAVR